MRTVVIDCPPLEAWIVNAGILGPPLREKADGRDAAGSPLRLPAPHCFGSVALDAEPAWLILRIVLQSRGRSIPN